VKGVSANVFWCLIFNINMSVERRLEDSFDLVQGSVGKDALKHLVNRCLRQVTANQMRSLETFDVKVLLDGFSDRFPFELIALAGIFWSHPHSPQMKHILAKTTTFWRAVARPNDTLLNAVSSSTTDQFIDDLTIEGRRSLAVAFTRD